MLRSDPTAADDIQPKPYMAAVSPNFFTHYGKTGDWAWNKLVRAPHMYVSDSQELDLSVL